MMLAIRTDQPEAELVLLSPEGAVRYRDTWLADRTLADTLLPHINALLEQADTSKQNITGIIVFTGSGSFTGLRIGTTVANTLAYGLRIPIASGAGENWVRDAIYALKNARSGEFVVPRYDREPNITN